MGSYLGLHRSCFLLGRTAGHFDSCGRGLLSDLPRKSIEPIALACGTAARILQEFLATASWDHQLARDTLPRHPAVFIAALPDDGLGPSDIEKIGQASFGNHTRVVLRSR